MAFLAPKYLRLPLVILPFTHQAGEHGPSAWLARCPAKNLRRIYEWLDFYILDLGRGIHFDFVPKRLGDAYCTGAYEDPEHPGCKREVRVEGMKVPWQSDKSDSMTGSRIGVGGFIFGTGSGQLHCFMFPGWDGSHCWKAHHSFSGTYFLCFDVSRFQVASEPVVKIES